MPHTLTIQPTTTPGATLLQLAKDEWQEANRRTTLADHIPRVPDFALPLINKEDVASFTRSNRRGRIYSQFRSMDDRTTHPHGFYVEWPLHSEDYYEIHAPTLASIAHQRTPQGHVFNVQEVACLLESVTNVPVLLTLHAARPRPAHG